MGALLKEGIELLETKIRCDIKIVQTRIVWAFLVLSIATFIIEGTKLFWFSSPDLKELLGSVNAALDIRSEEVAKMTIIIPLNLNSN